MKHKFEALPCISNETGHTIRPYALDDEIIYEMNLNLLLHDEATGKQTQIKQLANVVSEKIGTIIQPENLIGYLQERCIEVKE